MIGRNFKPGGKLSINLKDIKNVMATAHALDVPLPFTSQLLEVMQALKVDGHLEDDHSGIVQYFEKLAGVQVHRPASETRAVSLTRHAPTAWPACLRRRELSPPTRAGD